MVSKNISAAIILVLMLASVRFGNSNKEIVDLNCRPAVGIIGENVNIICSIKINADAQSQNYTIYVVILTKMDQENVIYNEGAITGDGRFKLPTKYAPSLMLSNITVSDEGEYQYFIDTSRGQSTAKITLNVSKSYNLKINSWPKVIIEDETVDLYCNASGGYPAATIQWFDRFDTDWTKNSALHITKRNNGLFDLSSKLRFRAFDPILEPFRCVVSSRHKEECTLALQSKNEGLTKEQSDNNLKQIFAPIIVIGSLIVGLLTLIYIRRRREQRSRRPSTVPILRGTPGANDTDVEEGDNSLLSPSM